MLANIALMTCIATTIHFFIYYGLIAFTALRNSICAYIVTDALGNIVSHLKLIILITIGLSAIQWLIHYI